MTDGLQVDSSLSNSERVSGKTGNVNFFNLLSYKHKHPFVSLPYLPISVEEMSFSWSKLNPSACAVDFILKAFKHTPVNYNCNKCYKSEVNLSVTEFS